MSKRMTAIAATALALAFGCEEGMNEEVELGQDEQEQAQDERQEAMEHEQQAQLEQQEAQQAQQLAQREQQEETQFNQGPGVGIEEENEPIAQGTPQQRQTEQQRLQQQRMQQQRQMGQQQGQMGQQQQLGQAGTPGQVVTTPSERNFNQTIAQLTRQMRQNDLEIIGQVRYDERMRQRLMREHEQQAQAGQQAQGGQQPSAQGGEIGDVRLLVFRRPDSEVMSIENQGAEALLDAPRAVLVYERGEEVIVAYRAPEQMAAAGEEEPTSELLARVVRDATQPAQQPTAQREQVEEEEPIASAEQRRLEQERAQTGLESETGTDVDVNIMDDERQARVQN